MTRVRDLLTRILNLAIALSIAFPVLAGSFWFSVATAQQTTTPASTPLGIMLVEVHREEGFSSDQYFWTRLGDANGNSLFYFTGSANAESIDFQPVQAAENATAFDDWSLVPNQDSKQWAYQSHSLYTWSRENEPGEIAINVALYGVGPDGEEPLQEIEGVHCCLQKGGRSHVLRRLPRQICPTV